MHECLPKHSRMATARMKQNRRTSEEVMKIGVSLVISEAGTKEKRSPRGLNNSSSLPSPGLLSPDAVDELPN